MEMDAFKLFEEDLKNEDVSFIHIQDKYLSLNNVKIPICYQADRIWLNIDRVTSLAWRKHMHRSSKVWRWNSTQFYWEIINFME